MTITGIDPIHDWIPLPMFRDDPSDHHMVQRSIDGGVTWTDMLSRMNANRLDVRWTRPAGTTHNNTAWQDSTNINAVTVVVGRRYVVMARLLLEAAKDGIEARMAIRSGAGWSRFFEQPTPGKLLDYNATTTVTAGATTLDVGCEIRAYQANAALRILNEEYHVLEFA